MQSSTVDLCNIRDRLTTLENILADPYSDLNIERIFDVFVCCVLDCQKLPKQDSQILGFSERFKESVKQLVNLRRQLNDFIIIASLGRGAYGRVDLVRETATGQIYAMKTLDKAKMLSQQADFWAEREIMTQRTSPWIVNLIYSFQDVRSLYMVMEYVPGGTLVCWMDEVDLISETVCRFYTAEIIQALSDLHAMGFIHRDIKPDNMLLDVNGHLKLADFGTCVRVDPVTHRVQCLNAVGTPDYISPEVLFAQSAGGGEYGFPVDWWAVGVLVYEMICGETPFYSQNLVMTYSKIMQHSNNLHLPQDVNMTPACRDFISRLLSSEEARLGSGSGGVEEIRSHPWFATSWSTAECIPAGVDEPGDENFFNWTWDTLRSVPLGPFHPTLASETDTSYFHDEDLDGGAVADADAVENDSVGLEEEEEKVLIKNGAECASDSKYESSQLSFAGFTFSSPKLAPFAGIFLRSTQNETSNSISKSCFDDAIKNVPSSISEATEICELKESLTRMELHLAASETRHAEDMRDAARRLEVAELELTANTSRMEAEISKWKAIAEGEVKVRHTPVSLQTSKAGDLTLVEGGNIAGHASHARLAHPERRQASLPAEMPQGEVNQEASVAATPTVDTAIDSAPVAPPPTKHLMQKLTQTEDQLLLMRRFAKLYKDACEEKKDQLVERDRQIASLFDALEAEKQASRSALLEEQERSTRYLERLKSAEQSSEVAVQRAKMSANEATALRDEVRCLREKLSKLYEDLATEKLKCSAAVNKIQQLTSTRLLLWATGRAPGTLQHSSAIDNISPQDQAASSSSYANTVSTITRSRKLSLSKPKLLLLDLPLNAIRHVRSVTSCDVLHAVPEDLPRIFQIIFDQCEAGGTSRRHLTALPSIPPPLLSLDGERSCSPESGAHCITPPPKSAPAAGLLGTSKTLPRKLSFSSSSTFSVANTSKSTAASLLKTRTGSSGQLFLHRVGSSSPHLLNSVATCNNSPLALMGHMLQRIHFRVPAVCELCKCACWHLLLPPPAFQCLRCQVKLHASHLESGDFILRPCGKSMTILLLRAPSEEVKQVWLNNLTTAIGNVNFTVNGGGGGGGGDPVNNNNNNSSGSSAASSISLCSPASREDQPRRSVDGCCNSSMLIVRSATLPYPSQVSSCPSHRRRDCSQRVQS